MYYMIFHFFRCHSSSISWIGRIQPRYCLWCPHLSYEHVSNHWLLLRVGKHGYESSLHGSSQQVKVKKSNFTKNIFAQFSIFFQINYNCRTSNRICAFIHLELYPYMRIHQRQIHPKSSRETSLCLPPISDS